jgi:putative peptidoglycan lipid II flippase
MSHVRLLKSVALMMTAALLGKALLVVRELLVAAYFGASAQTDAYNVALAIVTGLLAVTVNPVEAVLVPVYVKWLAEDRDRSRDLLNALFTLYAILLGFCLALVLLTAPFWVRLYAAGFDADTQALTESLLRVMTLFLVVTGFSAYLNQILTAHHKFRLVALTPVAANLLTVLLLWVLAPRSGIYILAWGAIAGAALQLVVYAWGLRRLGVSQMLSLRRLGELRRLGKLALWMVGGRLTGQLSALVDRNLLSRLPAGAIATLGFGRSVYMLPFEIFTTGITRVAISHFSWDVAQGNVEGLKRNLSLSIRLAAFLILPAAVGLIVLRDPIVRLLYERGQFTAADTAATARVVTCFAIGLFFDAVKFIAVRVYLARQDVAFPVLMSLPSLALSVGFDLLLVPVLGAAGVALAYTLSNLVIGAIFVARLRIQLGPLGGARIALATAKIIAATVIMGLAVYAALLATHGLPDGVLYQIAKLVVTVLLGGLVYLGGLYLLRLEELTLVRDMVRDLWRKYLGQGGMP